MKSALIGYTGFVGGSLQRQHTFSNLYNSKNINQIREKKYDLLVCAAAPGKKWLANREPKNDLSSINTLIANLREAKVKKFILISTVDVYPTPINVNEGTRINKLKQHSYGRHRLFLEEFVQKQFDDSVVIRLPALFGPGLRKNFIFDLINNRFLDQVHPKSQFQFYNMTKLWKDIQKIIETDIPLINFATQPIKAGIIAEKTIGISLKSKPNIKPVIYDMHTQYSNLFNKSGHYLYTKKLILKELIDFIKSNRETKYE